MLQYYFRLVRVASTHSLSTSQDIVFFVLLCSGIAPYGARWLPMKLDFVVWLSAIDPWMAAILAFGSVFLIRIILAPYWIYKELAGRLAEYEKDGRALVFDEQTADLKRKNERKKEEIEARRIAFQENADKAASRLLRNLFAPAKNSGETKATDKQ